MSGWKRWLRVRYGMENRALSYYRSYFMEEGGGRDTTERKGELEKEIERDRKTEQRFGEVVEYIKKKHVMP